MNNFSASSGSNHVPTDEFIITIDGPAGAGKSTVARQLAALFDFAFLDTGAMYRAVTLACIRNNTDWSDSVVIRDIAQSIQIRFASSRVYLNDEDVTEEIRLRDVGTCIHYVADNPGVRSVLKGLQQRIGRGQKIVTEGRDQGTEVFPEAQCKFFLTAQKETRAERRTNELRDRGHDVEYEQVLADQEERDRKDSVRPVGALRPAADAVIIETDSMSHEQVVAALAEHVRNRFANL